LKNIVAYKNTNYVKIKFAFCFSAAYEKIALHASTLCATIIPMAVLFIVFRIYTTSTGRPYKERKNYSLDPNKTDKILD